MLEILQRVDIAHAFQQADAVTQAVRIGEHPDVLLTVVVCQDGFITSHGVERVEVYEESEVKALVGEYHARWPLLDLDKPKT